MVYPNYSLFYPSEESEDLSVLGLGIDRTSTTELADIQTVDNSVDRWVATPERCGLMVGPDCRGKCYIH